MHAGDADAESEKRGMEKGIEIGTERGIEIANERTAKNLIALGLPTDIIVQGTGLSAGIIDAMR